MKRKVEKIVGVVLVVVMVFGYLMPLTTGVGKANYLDYECYEEHEHDHSEDSTQCGDFDGCENVNCGEHDNCAYDEMERYGFSCSSSSSASVCHIGFAP